MILTGKTKEDFEKWLNKEMYYLGRHNFEDRDNNIEDLSDIFQNALIIEWFDSVRIYVNAVRYSGEFWKGIAEHERTEIHLSRQEAINKAIEKANEIYNEKK